MSTLSIGSYSHGTLRAQDLADTLRDMLLSMEHTESDSIVQELGAIVGDEGRDTEYDPEVISDAIDILQDYAPPFCYVGMSEGDGSDLGVWFDSEAFESARREGDILTVSDSSELDDMAKEDVAAFNYIAIVSDHGNISLYAVRVGLGEELLSVV